MSPSERLRAAWLRLPEPVRLFGRDVFEGAIAGVLVLNFALPHSLAEATSQVMLTAAAIVPAVVAAARRYLVPAAIAWYVATFPRPA